MNSTYIIDDIDTIDLSNITIDTSSLSLGVNGTNWGDFVINNNVNYASEGVKISGTGIEMDEDADIKIGERSLMKTLDAINERLAIVERNLKLEEEFAELKELGEQYRKLEQELKERMTTWDLLASRQDS